MTIKVPDKVSEALQNMIGSERERKGEIVCRKKDAGR